MSNPTLVRRVTAALTTLEEARTVETRPAVIAALTDSIDALNGFLLDLKSAEPEETDEDTKALVKPEPLDLHAEIRRLFLAPAHMSVVA